MTLLYSAHRVILLQILKALYSDSEIAPFLGFKGGTAAYLFYHLDRLSVDLDFDLLKEDDIDGLFEKISHLLEAFGVIKDAREKRYSLFWLLSYQDDAPNIKIEINKRSFGSKYCLKNYLGISMLVMTPEDMFSHKLVAMYERLGKSNRDIYDVCFFLKNRWQLNKDIVKFRTKLPFGDFLRKCIGDLERLTSRNILNGIGELLNQDQKRWVKKNLISETIFLLKVMLGEAGVASLHITQ